MWVLLLPCWHLIEVFSQLQGILEKATAKSLEAIRDELEIWEDENRRVQALRPLHNAVTTSKTKEIPALEEQIREKEATHPDLANTADSVILLIISQ